MSCPICAESFTESTRRQIECNLCKFKYCTQCIKKYILSIYHDPRCMNCHQPWEQTFMNTILSKNFINTEYKKHRENILFEREERFIPETIQLMDLNREQKLECQQLLTLALHEKEELLNRLSEMNHRILQYRHQIYVLDNNPTMTVSGIKLKTNEKKRWVKKCMTDHCLGYYNQQGLCSLCQVSICVQCYEEKNGEEHVCDESNVAAIECIKQETRPCPQCNVSIYRTEGCDQMWCTQCHTAFHWKSGFILNQEIHNPHYYEYLQTNPIQVRQLSLSEEEQELSQPSASQIHQLRIDESCKRRLSNIHRMMNHMIHEEMPKYRLNEEDESLFRRNLNQRILYIQHRISISKFKQSLLLKENQQERKKAIYLLFQMVVQTLSSLFQELMRTKEPESFFQKYNQLLTYTNQQLVSLCKRFKIHSFYLNDNFNIIRL